ncbi:hypothetical protein [Labrys sp. 22185]|uniref:hypothetical protein n=1 Tax=Labrys sp. 22185 TaxID=3453888 RepID=UPI003F87A576
MANIENPCKHSRSRSFLSPAILAAAGTWSSPDRRQNGLDAVASLWSTIWSLPPRNIEDEIIDLTNGFKDRRPSGHPVLAVREKWLARISKAAS